MDISQRQHLQKWLLVALPGRNKNLLVSGVWFLAGYIPEFPDASPAGLAHGQAQNGCVTEKPQPTAAYLSPVTMGMWEQEGHELHASPVLISEAPFPQWAAET